MFYNSLIRTCAVLVLVSPIACVYAVNPEDFVTPGYIVAGLGSASHFNNEQIRAQQKLKQLEDIKKISLARRLKNNFSIKGIRIADSYDQYLHNRFGREIKATIRGSRVGKWGSLAMMLWMLRGY